MKLSIKLKQSIKEQTRQETKMKWHKWVKLINMIKNGCLQIHHKIWTLKQLKFISHTMAAVGDGQDEVGSTLAQHFINNLTYDNIHRTPSENTRQVIRIFYLHLHANAKAADYAQKTSAPTLSLLTSSFKSWPAENTGPAARRIITRKSFLSISRVKCSFRDSNIANDRAFLWGTEKKQQQKLHTTGFKGTGNPSPFYNLPQVLCKKKMNFAFNHRDTEFNMQAHGIHIEYTARNLFMWCHKHKYYPSCQ